MLSFTALPFHIYGTYKSVHKLCYPADEYAAMVELPDRRKHVYLCATSYITYLL